MKKILLLLSFLFVFTAVNAQWQQTSLNSVSVWSFGVNGNTLFAGTIGNNIFKSSDNGNNWVAANTGLTYGYEEVNAFGIDGSNIYTGTTHDGIYLSTNNGSSWTNIKPMFNSNFANTPTVATIAMDGSNIYVGNGAGVFLSANYGSTWTTLNNGLPYGPSVLTINGSNIYAGIWGDGFYLSTNNGTNWTQMNNGMTDNLINAIATIGNNIFVATELGGLFLSTNNGSNWTGINTGISPSNPVKAFAIDGSNIFAGTDGAGVYLSTNNGTTWQLINEGLTDDNILALAIHGDTIFAGLRYAGVWKRSISELLQTSCSAQFTMTPDPFILHHYYAENFASGVQPLSYLWSWDDGIFDTIALPSHTYSSTGYYNICLTITDNVGCTSTFCDSSYLDKSTNSILTVDVVPPGYLGINESHNLPVISIFPNPSNGLINIAFAESTKDNKIEVLNSLGQLVFTKDISKQSTTIIDLTNHTKGIYFIKVQSGNGVIVRKVVIE
jgi:hypothetical protein